MYDMQRGTSIDTSTDTITRTDFGDIIYPESDGLPMADNTRQFQWILTLYSGLASWYRHDENVFVAGNLFWYPVHGDPRIRTAPDVMLAFGRPKGHRSSYKQWEESGIAPQIVVEILSPGNSAMEMMNKLEWYERYGVEEYYLFDPDSVSFKAWQREGQYLRLIQDANVKSRRMSITFSIVDDSLEVIFPNGATLEGLLEVYDRAEAEKYRADEERERADEERERAKAAKLQAEAEKERAEAEKERADKLAAKLRALGIDPEA
jgi:Uma2 family endonuclease